MEKPAVVKPGDEVNHWGIVFGTPIVVKGFTWLPITQLFTWMVMTWIAGLKHKQRSFLERLGVGALTSTIILGSEWLHNLAHAAVAWLVSKPMDALRVTWGMPLVVYFQVDDPQVTPREHILRALGGPVFNLGLLVVASLVRPFTRPGSAARDAADAAVGMNLFLSIASWLPVPVLDGGPILKWSLVASGRSREQADQVIEKANLVAGGLLGAASGWVFKNRGGFWGGVLALLSAMCFLFGLGLIRERE